MCCFEGPTNIFCIKDCKEKLLCCCQLCEKEEADFDNYSELEQETESESHHYSSEERDGDTSLDSESEY